MIETVFIGIRRLRSAIHRSSSPIPPMMRSILFRSLPLLCAGMLAIPAAAQAQSPADLAPGTRVRIADSAVGHMMGTVAEVRGDSLFVLTAAGDGVRTSAVSLRSIHSLQVSRGRGRPLAALRGAGVGLLGGAVIGAGTWMLIGLADGPCDPQEEALCIDMEMGAIVGGMLGAVHGTVLGAVLGFTLAEERWTAVPLRGAPVLTVSPGGGMRVGLSFSLR